MKTGNHKRLEEENKVRGDTHKVALGGLGHGSAT